MSKHLDIKRYLTKLHIPHCGDESITAMLMKMKSDGLYLLEQLEGADRALSDLEYDFNAARATITALEATMEKIGALPESWRSLIGVSVSTKEIDKAVDTVFEDLSFELQALLKQEQE